MEDTVFAKIIRRELPADIVYEDSDTIAFLNIAPNTPGHTLVVPKNPCRNLLDMDDATAEALIRSVKKVAQAIKKALSADGITIKMNNETAGGQLVFHAHMHVIPRHESDDYASGPKGPYAPGEAAALAERIRAAF
ncbi:MAG: HIT family protein [Candidatus Paceibacterota bacterium]